jgi:chromosome segregation ATPase
MLFPKQNALADENLCLHLRNTNQTKIIEGMKEGHSKKRLEMQVGNYNMELSRDYYIMHCVKLNGEVDGLKLVIEQGHNTVRETITISENEKHAREKADFTARKLQNTIECQCLELEEKSKRILPIQKSKQDLQGQIKELAGALDEERTKRSAEELSKTSAENQLVGFRRKTEDEMAAKDQKMTKMQRTLTNVSNEVNSLGEQLVYTKTERNDAIKAKKNLEAQVTVLMTRAEVSSKNN